MISEVAESKLDWDVGVVFTPRVPDDVGLVDYGGLTTKPVCFYVYAISFFHFWPERQPDHWQQCNQVYYTKNDI